MSAAKQGAVQSWPTETLVTPDGVRLTKADDVGVTEAKRILREGCSSIAIINIGETPGWCFAGDALAAWSTEIRGHLVEPNQLAFSDDLQGGYCYFGSRWSGTDDEGDVLVFFKSH